MLTQSSLSTPEQFSPRTAPRTDRGFAPRSILLAFTAFAWLALALPASAAPRDVQIVNIDFETQVIELFNFGTELEDLSGWRFCTHDDSVVRRYSSNIGLNGVSIAAGESLFIHLLSDSGGAPNTVDRPGGFFAEPVTAGAYGIQIYFPPVSFGNGASIADHLQWSIGGVDDTSADDRSDEAEAGGVWTDQSEWAVTSADSTSIMLVAAANGEILHGPDDYQAVPEPGMAIGLGAGLFGLAGLGRRLGRKKSS